MKISTVAKLNCTGWLEHYSSKAISSRDIAIIMVVRITIRDRGLTIVARFEVTFKQLGQAVLNHTSKLLLQALTVGVKHLSLYLLMSCPMSYTQMTYLEKKITIILSSKDQCHRNPPEQIQLILATLDCLLYITENFLSYCHLVKSSQTEYQHDRTWFESISKFCFTYLSFFLLSCCHLHVTYSRQSA